jgi:hypothetical protein
MSPMRETQSWFRSRMLPDVRIVISALVIGLLVGGCGFGLDHLVHHASRIYASDLYTCVVASVLSFLLMIYEQRRRMILARRMAIAAEVNHHIRNALTAIVYSARSVVAGDSQRCDRPHRLGTDDGSARRGETVDVAGPGSGMASGRLARGGPGSRSHEIEESPL